MIFITGAASTGKTSIVKQLKELLPASKFDIHDIDEADKWKPDQYEQWRDAKVEHFLKLSITNREKGIETVLCGIIYPEQAKKSPSFKKAEPVRFIFLDASPETIKERFYKRWQLRIDRQIEIENELRMEIDHQEHASVVNTDRISNSEASKTIKGLIGAQELNERTS
jgi:thymidylate kinase